MPKSITFFVSGETERPSKSFKYTKIVLYVINYCIPGP